MARGPAKGNQFWTLRSKHGRDAIFSDPKLMWEAACDYFAHCTATPLMGEEIHNGKRMKIKKVQAFTVTGLCLYMHVNEKYLYNFKKKVSCTEEFMEVIQMIEDTIKTQKLTAAYAGLINPAVAIRDIGLRDHIETKNDNNNVNYNSVPVTKEEAREIAKALEEEY